MDSTVEKKMVERSAPVPLQRVRLRDVPAVDAAASSSTLYGQPGKSMLTSWFVV